MATGRDLIKGAFRLAGIYASSEEPSAEEINDALSSLNEMIESMGLESLFPYVTESALYNFTGGQATYTLGPAISNDWVISQKPENIEFATVRLPDGADLPIELVTDRDYSTIITKDSPTTLPLYLLVNNYPTYLSLTLWPVPSDGGYGLTVYYKNRFTVYTLDDDIDLPDGYFRMLRYNLAIEISPEYGVDISEAVAMIARESLASVKRRNHQIEKVGCDAGVLAPKQTFNWLTGE